MLKKSTLLFIGTFFLLFIGLSDYGYGCHGGKPPHKGCGGVVDGLKANLTEGIFVLDKPLVVNLDKKGRIFTSDDALTLKQQEGLEPQWDAVFEACQETMLSTLEIPTAIHFGTDWRIAANAGLIMLRLFDAGVESEAEIDLYLFGDSLDYAGTPIPPDDGEISVFTLDRWTIFGGSVRGVHPPESCHVEGDLWPPSTLTICGADVSPEQDNSVAWELACSNDDP